MSLYVPFWLFKMMKDVNELAGEEIFAPNERFKSLLTYYFLAVGSSICASYLVDYQVFGDTLGIYLVFYAIGSVIFLRWIYLVFTTIDRLGKSISQLQSRLGMTERYSPDVIFFLTAFGMVSVPYLQDKLNRLIYTVRENQVGVSS